MPKYKCDRGHELDGTPTTYESTATNLAGETVKNTYTYCYDCQAEDAQNRWPLHEVTEVVTVTHEVTAGGDTKVVSSESAPAAEGKHAVKAKQGKQY